LVPAAVPAAPQAEGNDHSPLLVIEDDPVFAGVVADIISDLGFEPVVANEGRTGLRIAREQHPCGIILDVKLADIDGFQVMQALRAEPATATIPVHFVSATDAAERGRALGAVGYLTKPATRAELVHVVAALVPRTAGRVCKVLLVEPNTSAARSLLHDLAPDNFQLHSAENARDALAMLEREHFDCMVLDLALPDMDGLDFLRTLTERSSDTPPVLVYTARALSKTEAQRLDAYAEAVVLKEGPSAERLLDEIRLFAERFRRGLPPRRNVMQALRSAGLRLEGRKVLVVDDDMRTVYALSALLRAKGAEVFVAENGRVALDALEQHPDTEMVLMDVMMPEMDGYEAMRRIRGDGRFGVLPIVALTAKAMKGDREKCIEAGASDYLPKPIDPERLFGVIHEQLGGVQHGA
jgi:CheY-like chemotaxis protein